MKFFSTKQISEKWGISPGRISRLCVQGRIEGAVLRDRRWLIPESTPKPADTRTKAAKALKKDDKYIFPFIIAVVHSKEQTESFSEDEKALYHADCLFEAGEHEKCISELKKLLASTGNKYIRLGVLYLMTFAYFYRKDMESMSKYAAEFKTACFENTGHRAELELLHDSFNFELSNGLDYTVNFSGTRPFDFSDDIIPYVATANAAAVLINSGLGSYSPDIISQEIICARIEQDGFYYCALLLHCYISLMYAARHNEVKERIHLKRAVDIAVEHNSFVALAEMTALTPDTGLEIMKDYPDDVARKYREYKSEYIKARAALTKYYSGSSALSLLSQDDCVLISYCLRDYDTEKIAELMSISQSGVKKRLTYLYRKLGVSNKKEMLNRYVTLVMNPSGKE